MQIINKKREGWNTGLGCRERDVSEHLKRLEGETGQKLVEVGNNSPIAQRRKSTYTFTAKELSEARHILQNVEGA